MQKYSPAFLIPFLIIILLFGCATKKSTDSLTKYVDPFIGTGGHGHTYPGASMPFGMVQLSPDTRLTGWDGCSAYHYSDSIIYGFSHTHLSGTGCSDYGDILLMPAVEKSNAHEDYWYKSTFSHKNEMAAPGFYQVLLDNGIQVDLTATKRTGFHKYTFPEDKEKSIVIDLKHRDEVIVSVITKVSDNEIEGFRRSKAWAEDQHVYFVARFSEPFSSCEILQNDSIMKGSTHESGKNIKAILSFSEAQNNTIYVKVGISAVSIDGARNNLETECPDWNFDEIKEAADSEWNKNLQKISIKGASEETSKIFYTALYHSLLNPNIFMDVDGKFRGTDLEIHQADDFEYYSVFSLWDTYRATHPLFTLIETEKTNDFINTFLAQYKYGGKLPVWELAGNYTGCMIGYHSVPVIADAYIKGINSFDASLALEAMIHSAKLDHLGLPEFEKYGYIPAEMEHESVSKTLEYAYDDWCIAKMAEKLGRNDIYEEFIKRAQNYQNIFDPSTGFMRARKNGGWWSPFDPKEVNFNYTEANSWQYSFYVPQDISGLMDLHGGEDAFAAKLDALFSESEQTTGRQQADITGLIGQYAHGNEPSHHIAYLYNYTGKPWKTQEIIHKIVREQYKNDPDGLCGNEDCGQMSSWYVLSTIGIYPVTPGSDIYAIGTISVPEAEIHLENGKVFKIAANNLSDKNFYIQSATLNGKPYTKSFLLHNDIISGGEIVFTMGDKPNQEWGSKSEDRPTSSISIDRISNVPYSENNTQTFTDSLLIKLHCNTNGADIFYSLTDDSPEGTFIKYENPFFVNETSTIYAYSKVQGMDKSHLMIKTVKKIPSGREIEIFSKCNPSYTAGGSHALINYIRGGNDFRTGDWQGYQDTDFEAVVDLGKISKINKIGAGFIQDTRSWIVMPTEVEILVSNDYKNYKSIGTIKHDIKPDNYSVTKMDLQLNELNLSARYVKVKAKNFGTLPEWHQGYGGEAFIFIDEIIIE